MKKSGLFQFVKFMLLSLIASAVEFASFALFNFVIFRKLSHIDFSWAVFEYSSQNGGLCAFLALALSFTLAQITNFLVQRHFTFKSRGNAAKSALMYFVMVVIMYVYVLWLPSVIGPWLYSKLGESAGALAVKLVSQFTSALIQFPLNKFLVMR